MHWVVVFDTLHVLAGDATTTFDCLGNFSCHFLNVTIHHTTTTHLYLHVLLVLESRASQPSTQAGLGAYSGHQQNILHCFLQYWSTHLSLCIRSGRALPASQHHVSEQLPEQ